MNVTSFHIICCPATRPAQIYVQLKCSHQVVQRATALPYHCPCPALYLLLVLPLPRPPRLTNHTFISARLGGTTLWSSTFISPGGILFRHCSMMRTDWRISSRRHRYLTEVTRSRQRSRGHSFIHFIHSFHSFISFIHFIHSFISFIHFIHSLMPFHSFHSFISFIHFIHSFHSFIHFIHSFISFIHSFHSFIHSAQQKICAPTGQPHRSPVYSRRVQPPQFLTCHRCRR